MIFLKQNKAKGRDTFFKEMASTDDFLALANDGVVVISSPNQLGTDFLFAKLDAGRGFFGG